MKRFELEPAKEATIITLAHFPRAPSPIKDGKKFCKGECQKELPVEQFPSEGGYICRACKSKKSKAARDERKREQQMYGVI